MPLLSSMQAQALAGRLPAASLVPCRVLKAIPVAPTRVSHRSTPRRPSSLQATAPDQPERPPPASRVTGSKRRTKLRMRRRRERPAGKGYSGQAEYEAIQQLLGDMGNGLNARDIHAADTLANDVMAQRMDSMLEGLTPEELLRLRQQYVPAVDTSEFWESAVWNGFMWELLRERLGPEDSALVTKLFGDNWDTMADIDEEWVQNQVLSMDDTDRMRLFSVLTKLSTIQAQVADLAQGQQTAAGMAEQLLQQQEQYMQQQQQQQQQQERQQPAEGSGREGAGIEVLQDGQTVIVGSGSGIDPQDPSASRPWGQWGSGAGSSSGDGSGGGSRAGSSSGASTSGGGALDADLLAEQMDSFTRHWQAANSGQQQWGKPMSRHFNTLKNIQFRLFELESLDTDNLEQYDMTQDDFMAAYDFVNEQMAALLSDMDSITDIATRSVLIYMETLAGEGDRQPGEVSQLEVTLDSLALLGTFLAAAENLEALKAWVRAHGARNQKLQLEELLEVSGLDEDDWFILTDQRAAAAEAFNEASASGRGGGRTLCRFIDQQRIQVLSALDSEALHFMAELEETDYSQDTLIKWSLHPKVGPKLISGDWVREQQLPQALQLLYTLAMQPGAAAGYDFGVNDRA